MAEPRILFVTSAAFNKVTGGGITFSNLFRGWPRDRLACVTSDTFPVSHEVCDSYFHLAGEIARWKGGKQPGGPRQPSAPSVAAPLRRPAWQQWLKTVLVGNAFPDRGRLSPQLAHFIDEFRPDVVFTILGTIGMMELVDAIHRRTGAALVVHFMDDWPATLYRGGLLAPLARRRMEGLLGRLTRGAALRLGIGTQMCRAYEKRYGAPFIPFQNTVDPVRIARPRPAQAAGRPARIVYCGSIFSNAQSESLIDIGEAVAELDRNGRSARLDIYSPPHLAAPFRSRLEVIPQVALHDTVRDDDTFFRLIRDADLLLLPVNFDADSHAFIRYSMPTKLPAYLASGTPILGYGPPDVAQLAELTERECGVVVGVRDRASLLDGLARALDDGALRATLSAHAVTLAQRAHDADTVRTAFQDTLRKLAP